MTVSEGISSSDRLRANQWVVLALGLNVWIVIDLWPVALSAHRRAWEGCLLLIPPGLLLLATRIMRRRTTAARWILLTFFPISVFAPLVIRSEIDNQIAFTPVVLLFAVLSLTAYIALTTEALSGHVRSRHSDYKPLALTDVPANRPVRVFLRRAVVALALVGSFCIAASGRAFGGFEQFMRDWGNASKQAGLLVTLVATSLAIAVLLSFLGPVLKAGEAYQPSWSERKRKVISAFVVALFGFLTFYLLQTR